MRFKAIAAIVSALAATSSCFAKEPAKQPPLPKQEAGHKEAPLQKPPAGHKEESAKPREKTEEHHKKHQAMMVPPPPPETPTVLPIPDDELMSILNVPVEYMTKEALKKKREDVASQIKDADSSIAEKQTQMDASKTRAKEFVSLYEEGVVSRRELETAQKDAEQLNKDFSKASNKLLEMKKLFARIDKRLSAMPAAVSKESKKTKTAKAAPKVHLSQKATPLKSEEKAPASNK